MPLNILKKKFGLAENESGGDNSAKVRAFLELAQMQRSRFFLELPRDITSLKDISGILTDFDSSNLNIELSGAAAASARWDNSPVICFFKVVERGPKKREAFLSFKSLLTQTRQDKEGVSIVSLRFPSALVATQRRRSMRLKVDVRNFAVISVWAYDSNKLDLNNPSIDIECFSKGQAKLDDISAGGIKITCKPDLLENSTLALKKGGRFVLQLRLKEEGDEDSSLWLVAKINNLQEDSNSNESTLGLEFLALGIINPETRKVTWEKVQDNAVPAISNWTYKWHLEIYREKGV